MSGSSPWISSLVLIAPVAGAAISAYTDVRSGKIKNWVTLPLIVLGWALSYADGGSRGLAFNVAASCLIGFLFALAGRIGEGDVKLVVGIAACLRPPLSLLFLAFAFMGLAAGAVLVRLWIYRFRLKPALAAMKAEALMELGGVRDANVTVHGEKVRHLGAPIILAALLACLAWASVRGLI